MQSRYERQLILKEIGQAGQERLSRARILCVGAGGLGSAALYYLASAGAGLLGIADNDTLSENNLQRQILYSTEELGQPKCLLAARRLKALNPGITTQTHCLRVDASNAAEIAREYDFVIDATDNHESKLLLNRVCVSLRKPLVHGSVSEFEGQFGVFDGSQGACYACCYPDAPKATAASGGILGPLPGIIGSAQALEAIKLVVQNEALPITYAKLHVIDCVHWDWRSLAVPRNPCCPHCQGQRS